MAWIGRSLALAVLVLVPSFVSAQQRGQPAGGERTAGAPVSSEASPPDGKGAPAVLYGFSGSGPGARYASLDALLDAALQEEGVEVEAEAVPEPQVPVAEAAPAAGTDRPIPAEDVPLARTDAPYFTAGDLCSRDNMAARLGWWAVSSDGDPTKVGEYQGLGSSPFWDFDLLSSDGRQTIDLTASGLDSEGTHVDLSAFWPRMAMDLDFDQYIHRLDHIPLTNFGDLTSTEQIVGEDFNVGENYAIRVQDLKYVVKGSLTENIKARVNFHMLRKFGERQANTVQHCAGFEGTGEGVCHVTSRRQRIDWLTVRVEPVVETRLGPVRAEYSRPMRFFSQNDQLLTANYGDFHVYDFGQEPYAVVPENYSEADRLKLAVDLGCATTFYSNAYIRNTHNKLRETDRKYYGFDLRLTNRSWDGVSLTAYATLNDQTNQSVPFLLSNEQAALESPTALIPPYGIRQPIDYFRKTLGADASWRPFRNTETLGGISFTAGSEFGRVERSFATYVVQVPEEPPGPVIDQQSTDYISGHVGTSIRWSPALETFVRYKARATRDPLFAVNRYTGYTSTSLPEQEDLVELGGTWMPSKRFLASATVGIENRANETDIASFEEDDYPMTCTVWYAPTPCWSLSAGYAQYSNWIDQNIAFPSDDPAIQTGDIRSWNYGGRGEVFSFGSDYAWSDSLLLVAGLELVTSRNAFDPLAPWPDLPYYSDVTVDRTRLTAGVDWRMFGQVSSYFRYIFEDYEDKSVDYNSGTAHMFLTGLGGVY